MSNTEKKVPRWLPLESNPEVMTKFMHNLGMSPAWTFTDVFGLEPELLAMLPGPTAALLFLFPITKKVEQFDTERLEKIGKDGQTVSPDVYFMKQTVGNACGTVGLFHAVLNTQNKIPLENSLKQFAEETKSMSADERAAFLAESDIISSAHHESAQEGQTEAPQINEHVNNHFISLIHKDGALYEMDGRKEFPINHGPTSDATFLNDAAKLCKEFMQRDPDELNFTIVALCKAD